jgi:hypothetical protein
VNCTQRSPPTTTHVPSCVAPLRGQLASDEVLFIFGSVRQYIPLHPSAEASILIKRTPLAEDMIGEGKEQVCVFTRNRRADPGAWVRGCVGVGELPGGGSADNCAEADHVCCQCHKCPTHTCSATSSAVLRVLS